MRIVVLADIHSNVVALDAVLDDASAWGPDRWICLGDVVGYGPDPGPCLARLREIGAESVQGNHEAAFLGLETGRFNRVAEAAIEYCHRVLDEDDRRQVEAFAPSLHVGDDASFVHGSIFDRDEYIFHLAQFRAALLRQETWLCFFGHTHMQLLYDGDRVVGGNKRFELSRDQKYLINPGSVGQPRDGDPRAAYARVDLGTGRLDLRRVGYDVTTVRDRVVEVGLPVYLGDRLEAGR